MTTRPTLTRLCFLSLLLILALVGCGGSSDSSPLPETAIPSNTTAHNEIPSAMAIDESSGTIYVAGNTSGDLGSTNAGNYDAFLLGYNAVGVLTWVRQWGTSANEAILGAAVDPTGGLFVTGRTFVDSKTSTAWFRKYDKNGNILLAEKVITGNLTDAVAYNPHGVSVGIDGTLYIGGYVSRTGGDTDGWLAAYAPDGQQLWFTLIDSGQDDFLFALAVDGTDGIYIGGNTYGALTGTNAGHRDAWFARYDNAGQLQWVQQIGTNQAETVSSIAADVDGLYLTGYTSGSLEGQNVGGQDIWTARYSLDGTQQWLMQDGTGGDDLALAIDHDNLEITVIGHSDGDLNRRSKGGQHDSWIVKFNLDGTVKGAFEYGLPHHEEARTGLTDSKGYTYMAGSTVVDDSTEQAHTSHSDAFVAKFGQNAKPLWIDILGSAHPIIGSEGTYQVDMVDELTRYIVPPYETDNRIDDWFEEHYVYADKNQTPSDKLIVHLPGSYGTPEHAQLYLQEVARQGHYVIALRYPNSWTVGNLCNSSSAELIEGEDCFADIREEIVTGEDTSNRVEISSANAINNRLVKLLQLLNQQEPGTGWDRWLNGNSLNWESVILTGHSQGGGHAAYISKSHTLARVVMLASPEDTNNDGTPATWLSTPGLTPTDRYYGFDHINDPAWSQNKVNWTLLGMAAYGDIVENSTSAPSFRNTHQLLTDIPPSSGVDSGMDAHGSVVTDSTTPTQADGTAVYTADGVWGYLCCSGM